MGWNQIVAATIKPRDRRFLTTGELRRSTSDGVGRLLTKLAETETSRLGTRVTAKFSQNGPSFAVQGA